MDKYEKQQEKEKQLYDKKHAEDFDSTYSNDPINEVSSASNFKGNGQRSV